jgi:signal transduction histidine kinase
MAGRRKSFMDIKTPHAWRVYSLPVMSEGRRVGGAEYRPAELAGLAGNLDQLLDRLSAVLRHEQQLTAELSHELRTPLAQITAEIDALWERAGTLQRSTGGRARWPVAGTDGQGGLAGWSTKN